MRAGSLSSSPNLRSHQHVAASEGCGIRNDPSAKQIEIDIAAAQDQAYPLAADFCLVLQRGGERGSAGAFRKIMRIGPVRPYRRRYLGVGNLHYARSTLANDRKRIGVGDTRRHAIGKRIAAL